MFTRFHPDSTRVELSSSRRRRTFRLDREELSLWEMTPKEKKVPHKSPNKEMESYSSRLRGELDAMKLPLSKKDHVCVKFLRNVTSVMSQRQVTNQETLRYYYLVDGI